ncbi:MAG: hypothetical protein AABX85_02145 [Nanoarchaeota archaeon]
MIAWKKGQEEIVGFVVVVVLVSIIAIIFLGISLRNDSVQVKESKDIRRFVDSALLYTSDCAFGYEPNYASLKDLIADCYRDSEKSCLDNRSVCVALNDTLKAMLDTSWNVGPDANVKGYEFKAFYSVNASDVDAVKIINIDRGNCSSETYTRGSDFFSTNRGTITCSLKVCYSSS